MVAMNKKKISALTNIFHKTGHTWWFSTCETSVDDDDEDDEEDYDDDCSSACSLKG